MIIVIFWATLALIAYTYILFPWLILLRGLIGNRPYKSTEMEPLPDLSFIKAAHNEAKTIESKIKNLLSMDYPKKRLEVVIASDGSNDGTDKIVEKFANRGVRLLSLPRQGKAAALNAAFAASSGEIIIFSDANSIYDQGALRALVRPFADPEVGGVAGNQRYLSENDGATTIRGEHAYWNFDRMLKRSQSKAGNTISATGAIYAIRRILFNPIPEGVTDDFFTSTGVIVQGYRLVFAQEAIAYEPVADSSGLEFGRKVRIMTRGLRAVMMRYQLLNPFRYGFYSLQLFSHKVLRRLVVFPLLLIFCISPLLWSQNVIYGAMFLGQLIFYILGVLGILFKGARFGQLKIFSFPFFFVMVNAAALVATFNILRGHRIDRWEPQRRELGGTKVVSPFILPSSAEKKSQL
jgi:cellulose synthase/poly-beta-1,6-N-acetylglucosamine synthase-like glycosyltransferase